jgi:hypothetical protein
MGIAVSASSYFLAFSQELLGSAVSKPLRLLTSME